MLNYDGELVRKNQELSKFVHEFLSNWEYGTPPMVDQMLVKALLAREVPYSHPIYGALEPKGELAMSWQALEPKGSVANAPHKK